MVSQTVELQVASRIYVTPALGHVTMLLGASVASATCNL